MDDKRRIPYNIWICVLSLVIILLIESVGFFIFSIGFNADQVAVISKERCNFCWSDYIYEYDYEIETKSDWRDLVGRILVQVIGIAIGIFGIFFGCIYGANRWWNEGEKNCQLKK